MTYHSLRRSQCCSNLAAEGDVTAVRKFMEEHGQALAHASRLLGGSAASGRVFLLIESLVGAVRLTRIQRNALVDLHRLLTLQYTSDPDRIESGLFASIDPDSRHAEDICRLADSLKSLLSKISAAHSGLTPISSAAINTPRLPGRQTATARPIPRDRDRQKRSHLRGGVA